MTPARPLVASVVALGIAGVFTAPAPATAAPAPCEKAERYAAQSGAELLRLTKLDLGLLRSSGGPASGGADSGAASGGEPAAGTTAGGSGGTTGASGYNGGRGDRASGGKPSGSRMTGTTGTNRGSGTTGASDTTGGSGKSGRSRAPARGSEARITGGSGTPAAFGKANGSGVAGGDKAVESGSTTRVARQPGTGSTTRIARQPSTGTTTRVAGWSGTGGSPGAGRKPGAGGAGRGNPDSARNGLTGILGLGSGSLSVPNRRAVGADPGANQPTGDTADTRTGSIRRNSATAGGRSGAAVNGAGSTSGTDTGGTAGADVSHSTPLGLGTADSRTNTGGESASVSTTQKVTDASAPGQGAAGSETTRDVAVGEAKSAVVGLAAPSAAAVTRMLAGSGDAELTKPLLQQAPPTNPEPSTRRTRPAEVGPILIDRGTLNAHAQWEPGMACGATVGKVTTAETTVSQALIARGDDASLVAVPGKGRSLSTTELKRHAEGARTVSSASIETNTIELLGGAVQVRIVRAPSLMTSMSTDDGGEVAYRPAVLEVSGKGVETAKLDTAGDSVELTLPDRRTESAPLLSGLPKSGGLTGASPLPLPAVPGLPSLGGSPTESAPAARSGTNLRISLGDVRQATSGHAIAAKVTAITITLTDGGSADRTKPGYGGGVVLDMGVGVLESAAVAPEPSGGAGAGAGVEGASAGLPLTGPRVDVLAFGGVALLVAGAAALFYGMRRRRFRS
jgi:hypothetical protein